MRLYRNAMKTLMALHKTTLTRPIRNASRAKFPPLMRTAAPNFSASSCRASMTQSWMMTDQNSAKPTIATSSTQK